MSRPGTPTRSRLAPEAKASPEIRAAIHAMRAKKQKPTQKEAPTPDPFAPHQTEDEDVFGLPRLGDLIHKARSSALGSAHHPSKKGNKQQDDPDDVRWYDQKPLASLKASGNEISELPKALAGFADSLEQLDLQSNLLRTLPDALMSLSILTVLNLSYNKLSGSLPLQLLSLDRLVTLDLSHNQLSSLWPKDWRSSLEELTASTSEEDEDDPDMSFNSTAGSASEFWAAFPSAAAAKSSKPTVPETHTPFPCLRTLNLSYNGFKNDSLDVDLPTFLTQLNLSANKLSSRIPCAVFSNLSSLQSLSLGMNGLDDQVFAPGGPEQPFLSALKDLDLSNNHLDSLEHIDALFAERPLLWSGVSKAIQSIIGPQALDGLNITVQGNPLRNELVRRRKLARAKPLASRQPAAKPAAGQDQELPEALESLSIRGPSSTAPSDTPEKPAEASFAVDPNGTLRMANASLAEFPNDQSTPAQSPRSIDLSRNQLVTIPALAFDRCGWTSILRHLDVSRNRLSALGTELEGVRLPALESLTLSGNKIKNADALARVAQLAPALKLLDLTCNYLPSLQGIDALFQGGLEVLKLAGNKIEDLTPLVEVANALKTDELPAASFRCRELDLADNAIGRLDPALGFLPLDSFAVGGNLFRIPPRKIYEDGGTKALLKYLKDRAD